MNNVILIAGAAVALATANAPPARATDKWEVKCQDGYTDLYGENPVPAKCIAYVDNVGVKFEFPTYMEGPTSVFEVDENGPRLVDARDLVDERCPPNNKPVRKASMAGASTNCRCPSRSRPFFRPRDITASKRRLWATSARSSACSPTSPMRAPPTTR